VQEALAAERKAERAARQEIEEGRAVLDRLGTVMSGGRLWPADRSGELEQSRQMLENAVAAAPRLPEGHLNLGRACLALGDLGRAEAEFEETLRLDPGCAGAWVQRASIRKQRGDAAGAERDFAQALLVDPGNVEALKGRALGRQVGGDLAGAISDWTELLASHPTLGEAYYRRGGARELAGDGEGAMADYDEALRRLAHVPEIRVYRARIFLARGETAAAIADLERAQRQLPRAAPEFAEAKRLLTEIAALDAGKRGQRGAVVADGR
jgi:tetratricopeptide (TPR) repeat protein